MLPCRLVGGLSCQLPGRRRMLAAVNVLVRCVRDLADIDRRQQRENKCLHKGDEDRERHQQHRQQDLRVRRKQIRDLARDLLVGEHVGEKSYTERHRPDQVTDRFDAEDQRRNKDRDHYRQLRAGEV